MRKLGTINSLHSAIQMVTAWYQVSVCVSSYLSESAYADINKHFANIFRPGQDVMPLFMKSGVPQNVLANIWYLFSVFEYVDYIDIISRPFSFLALFWYITV